MRMFVFLAIALMTAISMSAQAPRQSVATPPPDVAAPPADAAKTPTGLASKVITPGTGKTHPSKTDIVTVHYTGWKTDGSMFDSSVLRDKPTSFPLDRVIAGWTEGVQLMVEGEKRRLWIPEGLAYKGTREPKGMLVFDVELLSILGTPPDVKAAPADAKRTASGIAYKVLKAGSGGRHPNANNTVSVNYSGWTTDGKMFDSSILRGQPASFGLGDVIKGWTEGVQLMTVGEKTRFWIPDTLAYKDQQGRPQGTLVFDIELLEIK
jgi:FKBP-type peptidyl-prolyl cis-trans isomerase